MADVDADDVMFDFHTDTEINGTVNLTFSGLENDLLVAKQNQDIFGGTSYPGSNDDVQEMSVIADEIETTHVDLSQYIKPSSVFSSDIKTNFTEKLSSPDKLLVNDPAMQSDPQNSTPEQSTLPALPEQSTQLFSPEQSTQQFSPVQPVSKQNSPEKLEQLTTPEESVPQQNLVLDSLPGLSDLNQGITSQDVSCDNIELQRSADLDGIEFDFDMAQPTNLMDTMLTLPARESNSLLKEDDDIKDFKFSEPVVADNDHHCANNDHHDADNIIPSEEPSATLSLTMEVTEHTKSPTSENNISCESAQYKPPEFSAMTESLSTVAEQRATKELINDEDDDFDCELPTQLSTQSMAAEEEDEFDFEINTKKDSGIKSEQDPISAPLTVNENEPGNTNGKSLNTPQLSGEGDNVSPGEDEDVKRAAEAWDNVTTVTPNIQESLDSHKTQASAQPLVGYGQFYDHCRQCGWETHKGSVVTHIQYKGISCIKNLFFGPSKLHQPLHEERDMVFCFAACSLNSDDAMHTKVLQTLHRKLTGSKFDCPRYGSHWEDIGFQGNDPATDLRSAGLLGLLQLLYFVTNGKTAALARDIYKLSLHETQNFPFCVMGINMTRICLMTLREGHLNKESNRQEMVLNVVNSLYAAIYLQLFTVWKTQRKTITDSGFVLKDVENYAKKNPKALMDNLSSYLDKKKAVMLPDDNVTSESTVTGAVTFMDVCAE